MYISRNISEPSWFKRELPEYTMLLSSNIHMTPISCLFAASGWTDGSVTRTEMIC